MHIKLIRIIASILIVGLASCNSSRNLVYLSNIENKAEYIEKVTNAPDSKIQPDDLLSITVTSLSPEAIAIFNVSTNAPSVNTGTVVNTNMNIEGYLVDKEGTIDYPVLGRVRLGGLTKSEAKSILEKELRRYLKDPIVRIRYLNYKITVVGEVNHPSTFTVPSEKINIIEALGMAGDMTVYGRRENVLVIREEEGERKIARLNLNDKEILNSPFFYLQQNDMVYVEPIKEKADQASLRRSNISLASSIVWGITSILSLVVAIML